MEWDDSDRKKGKDGQKKNIGKANEKREREKVKKSKRRGSEWTGGKRKGMGAPAPPPLIQLH